MEQLTVRKKRGINGNALRTWGLLFLAAGVIGRGLIQTHMLGARQLNTQQLLEVMESSRQAMGLVTCSLVLQALETCAVPLYALMLVEGAQNTSDYKRYFQRVAGLAVLCELPYNLAIGGRLIDLDSRNPVFSLVMAMVMLYLYGRFPGEKLGNKLAKLLITVMSLVWCGMLKIEFGPEIILLVAVLWRFRKNTIYRNFAGVAAAVACTLFSTFFLASPMSFMIVHGYDGEKSTNSRRANYLAYPAVLLAAAIVGLVL